MAVIRKNEAKVSHCPPQESVDNPIAFVASPYRDVERYEMPAYMARIVLYLCTGFLLFAFVWSALAHVDVVAAAPGQTVPRSKVRPIQPEADGVVDSLLVREGEVVDANQKLLLLDLTTYKNELDQKKRDLDIASNQLEQVKSAKIALAHIIVDPDTLPGTGMDIAGVATTVSRVHAAFVQSREAVSDTLSNGRENNSETAQLKNQERNLNAERSAELQIKSERVQESLSKLVQNRIEIETYAKLSAAAEEELIHLQSILDKTVAEETAFRMLMGQGAVSRVDHFRIEREVSRVRQELVRQRANVAELQKKIEIAKSAQHQLRAERLRAEAEQEGRASRIAANLNGVNIQMRAAKRQNALSNAELAAALSSARAALSRMETDEKQGEARVRQCQSAVELAQHNLASAELKAPLPGVITNISVKGRGQVVRRGDVLMSVMPKNSDMVVECLVGSKDIGFVEVGQRAKLKLTAFPFEDFGIVSGHVVEVAKESGNDPKLGLVYKTVIALDRQTIKAKGREISFASGMGATCEIVIRRRTVLSILLEPVKRLKETRWL